MIVLKKVPEIGYCETDLSATPIHVLLLTSVFQSPEVQKLRRKRQWQLEMDYRRTGLQVLAGSKFSEGGVALRPSSGFPIV